MCYIRVPLGYIAFKSIFMDLWDFEDGLKWAKNMVSKIAHNIFLKTG